MASKRSLYWTVVAVYAALVLVTAVIPTPEGPSIPHLDKAVHLCEYLLLAWLLSVALRTGGLTAHDYLILAWIYATSYGLLIELIQALVPWRSCDLWDAAADAAGAAIGVWLGRRIPKNI